MDQTWIQILVILVSYKQLASGAMGPVPNQIQLKEGSSYEIKCTPPGGPGTMIVWFRVLDKSGMEFIGSFSNTGVEKTLHDSYENIYSHKKTGDPFHLTLKSFREDRDSGAYSCASLKSNALNFGEITRLRGEQKETIKAPPTRASTQTPSTTSTAKCACEDKGKRGDRSPSMFCAPIILAPLAGGCGLLLLLLFVTILYCNHIRTRRCPHHYKRRPRMAPPEKHMMTDRQF